MPTPPGSPAPTPADVGLRTMSLIPGATPPTSRFMRVVAVHRHVTAAHIRAEAEPKSLRAVAELAWAELTDRALLADDEDG